MEEYKLQIPVTVTLTSENIDDIMVSALEGGITHWVSGKVYPLNNDYRGAKWASHALSKGATLLIYPDDEEKAEELTIMNFLEGYKKWVESQFERHNDLPEIGFIDAEQADMIVQFALFGDLVYS